MEDLIACLYPYDDRKPYLARDTVTKPENSSRRIAALKELQELPGRRSRESTAPLGSSEEDTPAWHHEEGLQLTFSHGPKAGLGFVLGTEASSCDICLSPSKDKTISRRHCYITFDAQRRLIVRDFSTQGTIIKYDGKGKKKKRRNFTWIVGGDQALDKTEEIVIQIHNNLKFQIVVSKPRFPDLFFDNVDQFRARVAENDELPFGALGLQSAISTAAASGTRTPKQREGTETPNENTILLRRKELGKGGFSVVYHVWDVSTGLEYASKKFRKPDKIDWKNEASLMRQTSHEHITRLIASIEKPSPRLILEYLPLRNLKEQHHQRTISRDEVLAVLHQGLLALTYLHGRTPPIAHRDIKPENILVQSRDPLHIKLSDFGLSKASDYLSTICGTLVYVAPEIARYYKSNSSERVKYGNAVDIWSLGVVIFQYGYGLPDADGEVGLAWCEKIIDQLDGCESDELIDLLSSMVVLDPKLRGCPTPTPASYGLQQPQTVYEHQETVVYCPVEDNADSQQGNPLDSIHDSEIEKYIRSPNSIRDSDIKKYIIASEVSLGSIRDSEIEKYIRPEAAPHPGARTSVEKRKRPTHSAASSTSSGRRTKRNVTASSEA